MHQSSDHADVKIHPPLLIILFLGLTYLANRFIPFPIAVPPILKIVGEVLLIIGFLLGAGAMQQFRRARTTVLPHGSVSRIIDWGIFRITRNPIYLGFLLSLVGFSLYLETWWGVILAPLFVYLMNKYVIEHEEAYLESKFQDSYTGYKSRVRRWL